MRFNPEDLASISSELAWMTRLADPRLRTLSARLVMAVFDDDKIHHETGDYAVSPGLPGPGTGGWRAVEDFVVLSAARNSSEALAALRGLERGGYLEQLEAGGLFRPAQGPAPGPSPPDPLV